LAQWWDSQIIDWYERAALWSDYPQGVFGSILQTEISTSDTVLDAGCGIGAVSIFAASLCRRVIAVDMQAEALQRVGEKAHKAGLDNLVTCWGGWPDVNVERADVTICSYAPPISRTVRGLEKLTRCHQTNRYYPNSLPECKRK